MKKILIVEDESLIAKIYATRLKAEGFEVLLADDGQKGLDLALKEAPSLILLDLMIPKISGSDVLAQLRQNKATKNTPILVYSNLSNDEKIAKVKQLGATEFLVKAKISAPDLVDKIKNYLN